MDTHILHDVFINVIVPHLFEINTNPTILIFKLVNKRTRNKLLNLVYGFFHAKPGAINSLSCDVNRGIVFPGYDERLVDLHWVDCLSVFKPLVYTRLRDLEGVEDRLSNQYDTIYQGLDVLYYKLDWRWKKINNIYVDYKASLSIILDRSLPFNQRLTLVEEYIHPLSGFFTDHMSTMTFYRALTDLGVVSMQLAVRLEPYIDELIDCFVVSCDLNMITMVSIAQHIDVFDNLVKHLRQYVYKCTNFISTPCKRLVTVCLEVDKEQMLKLLNTDAYNAKQTIFNRSMSSHMLERKIYKVCDDIDDKGTKRNKQETLELYRRLL